MSLHPSIAAVAEQHRRDLTARAEACRLARAARSRSGTHGTPGRCATCVNRSSKPGRGPFQRARGRRTRHRPCYRSSPASTRTRKPINYFTRHQT